jgi:hypothetical protein
MDRGECCTVSQLPRQMEACSRRNQDSHTRLLAAHRGLHWRAPGALQRPITGAYYRGAKWGGKLPGDQTAVQPAEVLVQTGTIRLPHGQRGQTMFLNHQGDKGVEKGFRGLVGFQGGTHKAAMQR